MRSRTGLPLAALAAALLAATVRAGPGAAPAAAAAPAASWAAAEPGYAWSFPRDHHAHPGFRNEWWYFTGTLEADGEPARRLGVQLTFFRVGLLPEAPALDSAWAAGAR